MNPKSSPNELQRECYLLIRKFLRSLELENIIRARELTKDLINYDKKALTGRRLIGSSILVGCS